MGTVALPISGLVNVQVSVAASATQAQNTTSLLLLTNNTVIDLKTRLLKYSTLAEVGTAFGTDSIEYSSAKLWFAQQPSPTDVLIGRWVKTAAEGILVGAPLTSQEQVMTGWQAITTGSFSIAVNGFPTQDITGIDLSADANLNAVAASIAAALTSAGISATCTWDGLSRFTFTSKTAGATSVVAPLTAAATGADLSTMLKCTAADAAGGSYTVAGADPETAEDAVVYFDLKFGYQWYGLVMPECSATDHVAVAQTIQGTSTKHFYGCTTSDPNTLLATSTTDLAYQLAQMALNKTASQFSSTSPYAIVSALGRILTTDYSQNTSVITLMYKQEPGVSAEYLDRTQLDAVTGKNCNVFVAYQGGALIIQNGTTTASDQYIDTVVGLDNLAIEVQLNIFNLLYMSPTKIPQTDAGMNQIVGAAETILLKFVDNGLLAAGIWTEAGFGKLATGGYLDKGYYIYCPPIAQQSTADRAKRMAGPMKIAVKLAGAIHTVDALIQVNP